MVPGWGEIVRRGKRGDEEEARRQLRKVAVGS